MATLILAAAGNALFPPPDQRGPRLDDLKLSTGSEGGAVWATYGQENRVPGQILWCSDLIRHTHTSGGKGGAEIETESVSADIAISLGEGAIDGIDKLWLNGQLFWDDTPSLSISSNLISIARTVVVHYYIDTGALNGTGASPTVNIVYEDLISPSGGPDLSVFRSGINATVSGAANANNNGTFRVVSASMDDATGISTLRLDNNNAQNGSASPTIVVTQSPPKFSPNSATAVTVYTGSATQNADPLIESHEGSGNVPAFRGEAYVVIQGLQLRDLGNFLPQSIDAMVRRTAAAQSLASAIQQMVIAAGRATSDVDVTDLNGVTLKGYATRGIQPTTQKLEPLALAFDLRTQEDQGVMRIFRRQNATVVSITESQIVLGDGDDRSKIRFRDTFTGRLPNEVNVAYIDPASDYQRGTAKERRAELSPTTDNKLDLDVPVTMTAVDANALCKRVLWTAWANRHRVEFLLPPSLLEVLENDIVRVNHQGVDFDFLVTQVTLGANGLLEVEAVTEETQTLTQTGVAQAGGASAGQSSEIFFPPLTYFIPMPIGPLREDEVNSPGFLWAGCYADPTEVFVGAGLFESRDVGANYAAVQQMLVESPIGFATTALGTVVNPYQWDRNRTVTVRLSQGELESCTDIECLNGKNRALIGGEVIGFTTATLIGTDTYTLSNLLRGLVNTELATGQHAIGDSFVLLEEGSLNLRSLSLGDFNATYLYKLVSQGGVVSDFNANSFPIRHPLLRHFPPCDVQGRRELATTDILVSWKRRARRPFRIFGEVAAQLDDTVESYVLEILGGTPPGAIGAVFGTYTITGAGVTNYRYTTAQQSADGFGSPGSPRYARMYQVSTLVGRSYPTETIII